MRRTDGFSDSGQKSDFQQKGLKMQKFVVLGIFLLQSRIACVNKLTESGVF